MASALRSKQAFSLEKLPGNGAGPDVGIRVLGVADPGDAMRIHPHLGALNSAQIGVGNGGLVAHAMEVVCPFDRLACVVTQGVLE